MERILSGDHRNVTCELHWPLGAFQSSPATAQLAEIITKTLCLYLLSSASASEEVTVRACDHIPVKEITACVLRLIHSLMCDLMFALFMLNGFYVTSL